MPLPAYPEPAARPGTGRARTAWLAAIGVAALLLASGILRFAWPADDGPGLAAPSAGSSARGGQPLAGVASAKPAATTAAAANPSLDPCLVGTWRMTSSQVVNHFEGVDARFSGGAGAVIRIWPDGREVDDFNKAAPLKATIKGAKYVEVLSGRESLHLETRNGRAYVSELSGGRRIKVTRNGRTVVNVAQVTPSDDLPYTCGDTRLTFYGTKVSTDSFVRVSRTP